MKTNERWSLDHLGSPPEQTSKAPLFQTQLSMHVPAHSYHRIVYPKDHGLDVTRCLRLSNVSTNIHEKMIVKGTRCSWNSSAKFSKVKSNTVAIKTKIRIAQRLQAIVSEILVLADAAVPWQFRTDTRIRVSKVLDPEASTGSRVIASKFWFLCESAPSP